jgi:tRNA-Thr(GGU) m(6)t(6)A37 methyltransferase TsaA
VALSDGPAVGGSVTLTVIGHARTPWTRREDAPHQPSAAPDAIGTIEIDAPYRAGLADLDSFSRIWLLFVFDRSKGWAAAVKPPRGGPKRGVLATRAPNRPSPIGLTSAALTGVDLAAGLVQVRGIDLLDGTPIVDIKPYIPSIDAWPDAGHGWLEPYLNAGIEPRLRKPYRPPRS